MRAGQSGKVKEGLLVPLNHCAGVATEYDKDIKKKNRSDLEELKPVTLQKT